MSTEDLDEYIVTLRDHNKLDNFYTDMEEPGGNLYIPNRSVEVAKRREISRNTHYFLSKEEAEQIRQDSRVLAVELAKRPNVIARPHGIISGPFNGGSAVTQNDKNWALDFCTRGVGDGGAGQASSVRITAAGRNVDVVIVDDHIREPDHPEYAVNADGSGGSRLIRYNWYGPYGGNYVYNINADDYHGSHVASTVAGNTQGWASSANIYNIDFRLNDAIDYVRLWHKNKAINPATGRKNPTIMNNSWGYSTTLTADNIMYVYARNGAYQWVKGAGDTRIPVSVMDDVGLRSYDANNWQITMPIRIPSLDADVQDAWNEGVIGTGSAGNDSYLIDMPGGLYYDDYILDSYGYRTYFHRGGSPGAAEYMITVGSLYAGGPQRSNFSNTGPGISIWAPGSYVMGVLPSFHSGVVADPRNGSYYLGKISGTSMASPQVAGILACIMEMHPNFTPIEAWNFMKSNAKYDLIKDANGTSLMDDFALLGAANRSLYYRKYRPDSGLNWPRISQATRPTTGQTWPRNKP